jgi:hypothetical protein
LHTGVESSNGTNVIEREASGGMHRKMEADEIRLGNAVQAQGFSGEIKHCHFMSFRSQPRGRGGYAKGLMPKLISGDEDDAHRFIIDGRNWLVSIGLINWS